MVGDDTQSVGEKLAALNAADVGLASEERRELLRRSLTDRSNFVVERAATLIGECVEPGFAGDLVDAYRRLLINPLKKDPKCLGKTAIAAALVQLEYDDADFYLAGIRYEQPEPFWNGSRDTAAELRGICAAGLVFSSGTLEVLNRCAVLLADKWMEARAGAARALGGLGKPDAAPLLRLKLLSGDESGDVIGECCAALLRVGGDGAIDEVNSIITSSTNHDILVQAALALGESRHPRAFGCLRAAWETQFSPSVRESLLLCIGLVRSNETTEFLHSLIHERNLETSRAAIRALKVHGDDQRLAIATIVAQRGGHRGLEAVFLEEWPDA